MSDARELALENKVFRLELRVEKLQAKCFEVDSLRQSRMHFIRESEKLQTQLAAANAALTAFGELIAESEGVAGLHLNGDLAFWDDLREGGKYEEWLAAYDYWKSED